MGPRMYVCMGCGEQFPVPSYTKQTLEGDYKVIVPICPYCGGQEVYVLA